MIADQQAAIQELTAKLERLERLKSATMRLASHDLRSTIGLVNGYLQLIRLDVYPELAPHEREYIDDLGKAIQRMNTILGDMLALERIDKLVDKPLTEKVDLAEVAQRSLQAFQEQAEQRDIVLQSENRLENSPLMVMGDGSQLLEAVANLLSNALRYTSKGGRIALRVYEDDGFGVLEVIDTGTGIAETDQHKMFQPFYHPKHGNGDETRGLGLGLHLVRHIVERHHGELIFQSVSGKGSTFGFKLPL